MRGLYTVSVLRALAKCFTQDPESEYPESEDKDGRHSGTSSSTFRIHQTAGATICRSAVGQTSIHAKYAQNYRAVLARLARVAR